MKNLVPYKDDCFEIHKACVNKKHNSDLKTRLIALQTEIEKEYGVYSQHFTTNELGQLASNAQLLASKDDLLTLYNYTNSVIKGFRDKLQKLQVRTIITTCQNCTIDTVHTLDHIIPKSSFPEFVVNPKNLFPCCSTCNSYKLDSLENDGNSGQKFLNLYLDTLPKVQYLFCDVFQDSDGEINFKLHLKNVDSKIDAKLFQTIENHFLKLRLFERMKLKSIEYISELKNTIVTMRKKRALEEVVNDLIDTSNANKLAYGENHWKCIIEISLLQSDLFIKSTETE